MITANLDLKYGTYPEARLVRIGNYVDGSPAIEASDDDGVIAKITVCMSEPPSPNCIWVKDYSENEGVAQSLLDAGLVISTGRTTQSGFVTVGEYELLGPLLEEALL